MPVEDKPVHPLTVLPADRRPGCWNKPRLTGYFAPDRKYRGSAYIERQSWVRTDFLDRKCDRVEGARCEGCNK